MICARSARTLMRIPCSLARASDRKHLRHQARAGATPISTAGLSAPPWAPSPRALRGYVSLDRSSISISSVPRISFFWRVGAPPCPRKGLCPPMQRPIHDALVISFLPERADTGPTG